MLRASVWALAAIAAVVFALFVPVDGEVLERAGYEDGNRPETWQAAGLMPISQSFHETAALGKTSGAAASATRTTGAEGSGERQRLDVRVVQADRRASHDASDARAAAIASPDPRPRNKGRVGRLAIAPPPQIVAAVPVPAATTSVAVIKDLQSQLRRVGCYHGRIDGDWGPASRYAMAAFTKAVNASLPVDRPDVVLLSLVRRHASQACGSNNRNQTTEVAASTPTTVRLPRSSAREPVLRDAPAPARAEAGNGQEDARLARLTNAPRIVRGDGVVTTRPRERVVVRRAVAKAVAFPSSRELPKKQVASTGSSIDTGSRMSLGVAPQGSGERAEPVTRAAKQAAAKAKRQARRERAQQRKTRRRRAARNKARSRRRWRGRRYRSRNWQRTVRRAVNLGGP